MKRTISLILALILICTLPGMFASDEFDLIDEEIPDNPVIIYDPETHDGYCSYCQSTTAHEYCTIIEYSYETSTTHRVYVEVQDICTSCNNRDILSYDYAEDHSFNHYGICVCGCTND